MNTAEKCADLNRHRCREILYSCGGLEIIESGLHQFEAVAPRSADLFDAITKLQVDDVSFTQTEIFVCSKYGALITTPRMIFVFD